jgi:hypothetical protein
VRAMGTACALYCIRINNHAWRPGSRYRVELLEIDPAAPRAFVRFLPPFSGVPPFERCSAALRTFGYLVGGAKVPSIRLQL